ncbi:hypothetical protein [Egibacter rhizosphaerae]|uniref:hypothetical protein n=1 Tax=Egibacter rhizosphaerae TaxID=1670831 RepID=UPI001F0F2EAC|nr:hypothetical protein [Egibacter rhizosphaerae]
MADAHADLDAVWDELEAEGRAELARQRPGAAPTARRVADCRYAGQSHELRLELERGDDVAARFHAAHEAQYGYATPDEPVTIVTARVVVEAAPALDELPAGWDQGPARPDRSRTVGVAGQQAEARVLDRAALRAGDTVNGPALIEQPDTTTLLAPDEHATVDRAGNLIVRW